jgi:hypothetical protein
MLPALRTIATASPGPSTNSHSALAVRLTDSQLAAAEAIAAAPLPALVAADTQFFAQCLRLLDTLPRRKDDDVGGQLRVRAYELAIGTRSRAELEFMVTHALRNCKFFPSTSECVEILSRWFRDDEAVKERNRAETAARHERQARFDEAMRWLCRGECDQVEIDALPQRWKEMAVTYGHLQRDDDGRFVLRPTAPTPEPEKPARPAPRCTNCQDIGRILTIEGEEADCPACAMVPA